MYGNKLRKKISWPDLIIYSANLHWVWSCHTYQSSTDLEIIKPQHVKQIYTLLGKEKPIRKLFPPHSMFVTEELLEESLLHPQKLNTHPRHPTISLLFSLSSLGKEIRSYNPHAPASRWHCSTPGCTKNVEMCSYAQRVKEWSVEEWRLLLGKNYNKIVGRLLSFVQACYWVP